MFYTTLLSPDYGYCHCMGFLRDWLLCIFDASLNAPPARNLGIVQLNYLRDWLLRIHADAQLNAFPARNLGKVQQENRIRYGIFCCISGYS